MYASPAPVSPCEQDPDGGLRVVDADLAAMAGGRVAEHAAAAVGR